MPRTQKTGKRKTDKPPRKGQPAQGVVAWDVQVTNQDGELVASYDILTLVLKRPGEGELDV
jgi:oxepin-CoA hydrolase/3-oxo-5,6-dehydrosuberyl-CoA semialdehyde dehydrogenase